jgi:hypothetical protein
MLLASNASGANDSLVHKHTLPWCSFPDLEALNTEPFIVKAGNPGVV